MATLQQQDYYQAIAENINFPTTPYINGRFVSAQSNQQFATINPATGAVLANISESNQNDIDYAVNLGQAAFDSGVWSQIAPSERKAVMLKFAQLIEDNSDELAVLESLESGKPISECVLTDLPETVSCIRWHAEAADKIYDQISPTDSRTVSLIVKEPLGVVACVLPWNFPLMMVAWKLGPALVSGNSVLVKPAEQTNMTTLRLAELATQAGIPDGVFNVVLGAASVGEVIGLHQDIQVISFTGSTEVGKLFLQYSAQSNLKKIVLECGGKNPAVVLSDAENLTDIAEQVVYAALWNMGQNCTANSRVIVHKDKKVELTQLILSELKNWHTGDPLAPENNLGAIISKEQYDKILSYIETGRRQGATLLSGGEAITLNNGLFIQPTLFDDITPDMSIAVEEIFGPVFAIITAESNEQAIEIANNTCYGLQASLYTSGLTNAHQYSKALQAGTVSVNCYAEGDIATPFGGYKMSGFGGRDNSLQAHDQYTETKTIWIKLT